MIYDSIIALNKKSVQNNISFLRSKFGEKVKISAVVKANTYGHGIEQIVPRIQNQLLKYKEMFAYFESNGLSAKYKHVANSAASFVYPETRMDMVRVGIMLYGFWSSTEVFVQYINNQNDRLDPLKRVLGWKSHIMSIKKVKSGEFFGYGISYLAQGDITTALVPVGYSMGYKRSLSNKGHVLIRGHRCNLIGLVNMNMIIIDVTNIKNVEVGDAVVLIGKQGKLEIKVSSFCNLCEDLNYEILAHLSESITRVVVK